MGNFFAMVIHPSTLAAAPDRPRETEVANRLSCPGARLQCPAPSRADFPSGQPTVCVEGWDVGVHATAAAVSAANPSNHHRRVLGIIELLHGLPVAKAEYLLQECRRAILLGSYADVTNQAYAVMVDDFNRMFDEDYKAPVKQ